MGKCFCIGDELDIISSVLGMSQILWRDLSPGL